LLHPFTKFNASLSRYTIYCWVVFRHVSAWCNKPSSESSMTHAAFTSTYLLEFLRVIKIDVVVNYS
jgi:hypothetical protein